MSFITSLRLVDFRSYSSLDIELDNGPIVIYGPNGAGKTNLLEAISLLSPGRGLRRASLDSLARSSGDIRAPAWGINAVLDNGERISTGQIPEHPRRRSVRIDGKTASATHMAEKLAIMWLTPAQDRLFTGPAADRRKFIDRFALTHTPKHGIASLRYEKARAERNRLLSEGIRDIGWYEALEADLAVQGTLISEARIRTCERLQAAIDARDSIFPQSNLRLEGTLETLFKDIGDANGVELAFKEQLALTRGQDMRAGRTLIGPHRTELHVAHKGKAMPAALCSTGEQKALLIGLVLAHARAQAQMPNTTAAMGAMDAMGASTIAGDHISPIVLLDEVTAHLDAVRRAALARELIDLGTQVFMTGTDAELFSDFAQKAQNFHIEGADVSPIIPAL